MLLRPDQLAAHLDKPLAPLYLLHGDEPLLVIEGRRRDPRRRPQAGLRGTRSHRRRHRLQVG
jgi:hypothetical protein